MPRQVAEVTADFDALTARDFSRARIGNVTHRCAVVRHLWVQCRVLLASQGGFVRRSSQSRAEHLGGMQRLETRIYWIGGIGISDAPYFSSIGRPPRERADSSLATTTRRCKEYRTTNVMARCDEP